MRTRFGAAGPRGLTLLAVTGVAGLLLALHGWANHNAGGALGPLATFSTAVRPSASAPATSGPATTGPSASAPTAAARSAAPASSPGPLLNSQPFAQYAFGIWPGTPSSAAKAALAGLSVSVRRQGAGLSITAGVNGQQPGAARFYPGGTHVYVVEASMGDDSGSSDYNLGDDGIVVTDAHGRIVS
jgi:hypothetical protein